MAIIPFKNVILMMQTHLSLSTATTHFSVSVSASASSSSSLTIDYLTTKCGFPLKSAIAISQNLDVNESNIQRSDAVVSLLKSYGFNDTHISKMIQKHPKLLNRYKVDENLKPKLEYLVEIGFSGPLLHEVIVSSPEILGTSLSNRIKPSLDFLRSFLGTEQRVKMAVKRNSRLLTNNLNATLQPNIELLVKEGFSLDALANFLGSHPFLMQSKADRLVSALKAVKDILMMHPTDLMFLYAVLSIAAIGVTLWKKKLQLFDSRGFSQQEAFTITKRYPPCFTLSEDNLRTKLDFYFNIVKLKRDDIISYPILLGFSIEKRIQPRHNVLLLLLSKKLLKEDAKIASLFTMSEADFENKFVTNHLLQVPSLLEVYNNDKAAVK